MSHDDRVALAALVMGGILAGGNAVGVRFTVLELDALWGAVLRFAVATAVFTAVMVGRRLPLPRGSELRGAVLYGLLGIGGAYAFAYHALARMQAGMGSVLVALVPLVTLALAVAQRQERARPSAVAGGLLALVGVGVLSSVSLDGTVPPAAFAAGLAGVACMAQAAIVARRLRRVHPVVLNTVGMAAGTVLLLVGSLVTGERLVLPALSATWVSLAYLVVGGSVGMFTAHLLVLRYWEASRAVYLTLLMPPVAITLSAWLDDEPITATLVGGALFTLAGVYVGAVRPAIIAARPQAQAPVAQRIGTAVAADEH